MSNVYFVSLSDPKETFYVVQDIWKESLGFDYPRFAGSDHRTIIVLEFEVASLQPLRLPVNYCIIHSVFHCFHRIRIQFGPS
jgi:hypothetical protein